MDHLAAQIGILVGAIALWQAAADLGWIDGFFWSKPSAIYDTLIKFFTEGDAWTDIGFTFRSTIFGFLLGTTLRLAARPVVLVVAQLRGDRAALHDLLRILAEACAGAAGDPGVRHGARVEGRYRDRADARRIDADRLCRRQGARSRQREAVLFARRDRWQVFRKLVVPFCLPWIISVLRVNIGLALTGAIVGEFIASQHGLGRAILYAGKTYDIALVWVAVLVLSTLAVVMYVAVSWLERMLRKGIKQ